MRKILFITSIMIAVMGMWLEATYAHGLGQVLENQVSETMRIELEHESPLIRVGEAIPISIQAKDENQTWEIEEVWIRIVNQTGEMVWSGRLKPEEMAPKIVRMIASFSQSGKHAVTLSIKLREFETMVNTDFMIEVNERKQSGVEKYWQLFTGLGMGILIGFLGSKLWRRKEK